MTDSLQGKYTLKCQEEGCPGQKIVDQDYGTGWSLGMIVSMDSSDPGRAQCLFCKKYNMMVTTAPQKALPPPPKGFTRVPTE